MVTIPARQARAFRVIDNRTSELTSWDTDFLPDALAGLDDLDIFSFDDVLPLAATDGKTDPDDIPETPKNPVTCKGDTWVLGRHRIACGCERNRLLTLRADRRRQGRHRAHRPDVIAGHCGPNPGASWTATPGPGALWRRDAGAGLEGIVRHVPDTLIMLGSPCILSRTPEITTSSGGMTLGVSPIRCQRSLAQRSSTRQHHVATPRRQDRRPPSGA